MNKLLVIAFSILSVFVIGCFAGGPAQGRASAQESEKFYIHNSFYSESSREVRRLDKIDNRHIFITMPMWSKNDERAMYVNPQKMIWQVNKKTNLWTIEILDW